MKQTKKLTAMLLSVCLVLSAFASIPVKAAKGPNTGEHSHSYIQISDWGEDYCEKIYDQGTINKLDLSGVTYDLATNTLTLNNVNKPNYDIEVNEMGDDFKIKVIGKNHMLKIKTWGFEYGGSLEIIGNGSLELNEQKLDIYPIYIDAENSDSRLKVSADTTLTLNSPKSDMFFICGTLAKENAIVIENAPDLTNNVARLQVITIPLGDEELYSKTNIKAYSISEFTTVYDCTYTEPEESDNENNYAEGEYVAIPYDEDGGICYRVYEIDYSDTLDCYLSYSTDLDDSESCLNELGFTISETKSEKKVAITDDLGDAHYLELYKKGNHTYGVEAFFETTNGKTIAKYDIYNVDDFDEEFPYVKLIETVDSLDSSYIPVAGQIGYSYFYTAPGKVTFTHIHAPKAVAQVPASTTAAGVKAHYYCDGCKKYFSDKDCKNEVTLQSLAIPKLVVTAPTTEEVKTQRITTTKIKTYKAKNLKKKKLVINLKARTSGNGKLTYKLGNMSKKLKKYIKVSKTGIVTIKKGAKKGTYKVVITAAKTATCKKTTKTVNIKIK